MPPLIKAMKLSVTLIDYEYPNEKGGGIPDPLIWDLADKDTLYIMVLAFGNGIIVEMRATGDSEDALELLRGVALGTGNCRRIEITDELCARLWLCRDGDECYAQGEINPGYIFIDPVPKPALVD